MGTVNIVDSVSTINASTFFSNSSEDEEWEGKCEMHSPQLEVLDRLSDGIAAALIVMFTLLKRRTNRRECCAGRPGIQPPVDFLRRESNRLSYAMAFGTVTASVTDLFFARLIAEDFVYLDGAPWMKVFGRILSVMEQVTINLPIFMCLSTDARLIGSITGLLYTAFRLYIQLANVFECPTLEDSVFPLWPTFFVLPSILFSAFLIVRFSVLIVAAVKWRTTSRGGYEQLNDDYRVAKNSDIAYVQSSLKEVRIMPEPWYIRFTNWIYTPRPDFKFSVQVVSCVLVSVVVVYQLVLLVVPDAVTELRYLAMELREEKTLTKYTNKEIHDFLVLLLDVLTDVLPYVSAAGVLHIYFQLYRMMRSHRRHVLRMIKSKKKFLPRKLPSSHTIVGHGLRYCGYQVAFVLWGYVVFVMTLLLIVLSIAALVIAQMKIPAFKRRLTSWALGILPAAGMIVFGWLLQKFLSYVVFRKRSEKSTKGIIINNRQLYLAFSFFFFFFNILVGLFACLIRLTTGLLFNIWFLGRVDRSVMMKGFHRLDRGYMAYLGFLHVQVAHKHPVLLVFCQTLIDSIYGSNIIKPIQEEDNVVKRPRVSYRGLNKWFLGVTLMNNRGLILKRYRKSALSPSVVTIENPLYGDSSQEEDDEESVDNEEGRLMEKEVCRQKIDLRSTDPDSITQPVQTF